MGNNLIDGLYSIYLESVKTGVVKRDHAIDREYSLYCKATQIKSLKWGRQTTLDEFDGFGISK